MWIITNGILAFFLILYAICFILDWFGMLDRKEKKPDPELAKKIELFRQKMEIARLEREKEKLDRELYINKIVLQDFERKAPKKEKPPLTGENKKDEDEDLLDLTVY